MNNRFFLALFLFICYNKVILTKGDDLLPDFFKNELLDKGIDLFGAIPMSKCKVTREYKLKNKGFCDLDALSVIVIAVPYLAKYGEKNISAYSVPRDYHAYFKALFKELLPKLKTKYPEYKFVGFADDSPIDERYAAAMAGLGIIGDNGMLITEKYSSYVFLAEIVTDYPMPHLKEKEYKIGRCEGCGKCRLACPMRDTGECLSALTQKKGELSPSEIASIQKYGSAWGCDKCQECCPHTIKAIKNETIYTNIEFFKRDLTPVISRKVIENMSDAEFSERAYSWRKKDTVLRNLEILEGTKKDVKE